MKKYINIFNIFRLNFFKKIFIYTTIKIINVFFAKFIKLHIKTSRVFFSNSHYITNILLFVIEVNNIKNVISVNYKNIFYFYKVKEHRYNYMFKLNVISVLADLQFFCINNTDKTNTCNFYFKTKVLNKKKLINFFYFNKLLLIKYPYFFWAFNPFYTKLKFNSNIASLIKVQLYFMYMYLLTTFFKKNKKISFNKINIYTFKGYTLFIKNNVKINIKGIVNFKKKSKNHIKKHINLSQHIVKDKISKAYSTLKSFNNYKNILTLTWYTKIHNTNSSQKNNIILYLRSQKHFNKGRYSRNRQLYRTGVYWCIWLNIVLVYGLYFYFYRVVFSFGYIWIPLCIMFLSIFSSRIYKYRFYSLLHLKVEFKEFYNWLYYILFYNNYIVTHSTKNNIEKIRHYYNIVYMYFTAFKKNLFI